MADPVQNTKCICEFCILLQSIKDNLVSSSSTDQTAQQMMHTTENLLNMIHKPADSVFICIFREMNVLAHAMLHMQGLLEHLSEEIKYSPDHRGYEKAKHEFEEFVTEPKRQKTEEK